MNETVLLHIQSSCAIKHLLMFQIFKKNSFKMLSNIHIFLNFDDAVVLHAHFLIGIALG